MDNIDLFHSNEKEIAEILKKDGDILSKYDEDYFSMLHSVCLYGRTKNVKLIIDYIIENNKLEYINMQNKYGVAPLHLASQSGREECVEILINNGAFINIIDKHGETPLHYACRHNRSTCTLLLIERGANLNIQDECGNTPLHYAFLNRSRECIRTMCRNGADITIKNNEGYTPFTA